jgi:multiple sugar transport system permease protein
LSVSVCSGRGFFDWNRFQPERLVLRWCEQLSSLVFDDLFLNALGVTIRFTIFALVSELILVYPCESARVRFSGEDLFRIIHTVPLMIAPIVGSIWRLMTIPGWTIPYFLDRWFDTSFNIAPTPIKRS